MTDKATERFTAQAEGLKIENKPNVDWGNVLKKLKDKENKKK